MASEPKQFSGKVVLVTGGTQGLGETIARLLVARGAARYARDCSGCHGVDARGNGPAAGALARKPANLAEHGLHHPPGNVFWWIAHGIPDTPMPAFSPRMSDREIWELVQFIVARASAASATTMGPRVNGQSMSRVPDFTYELPRQEQRTLSGQRTPALIVLYTLPMSAPRLAELASDHRLMQANLRVIAIPLPGSQPADGTAAPPTIADPDARSVYALFARSPGGGQAVHAELLVDAGGVLRARWIGLPAQDGGRNAAIAAAAQHLPAAPKMPASMHHGH